MERIETVIVGGGQAGLATSYWLSQYGREHTVLEQAPHAAEVWRSERWDSFTLVTPNWALKVPGAEYSGDEPDAFMPREEVTAYFDAYVERFHLPVQVDSRVLSVESADGGGYQVATPERQLKADNVVIATGLFQKPKIPAWASDLPRDILQLHSSAYRNPESLPDGAVMVAGTAQSGCQIAEELYLSGREVFLCTCRAGRAPRRYRGRDVFEWLVSTGFFDLTPERLPPGTRPFEGIPHISGTRGGHTLNLHQFARDGVILLGHLRGAADQKVGLAADLDANLMRADRFEAEVTKRIDGFIEARGLDAPPEELPDLQEGYGEPPVEELDLKANHVGTIIWAAGYSFDYGLVKLPVLDESGFPVQTNGVTAYPGLYFTGMPWMPSQRSGMLLGVGEVSERTASRIAGSARAAPSSRSYSIPSG